MQTLQTADMRELTAEQIELVSGGIFFAPAVYAAFVSGAKWGGGIALALVALSE